jgi:hypothetical protein
MFRLADAVEEKFGSFNETLAFVSEEKRRIVRLPLFGLWKSGARFQDDGSFGRNGTSVKFNSHRLSFGCPSMATADEVSVHVVSKVLLSTSDPAHARQCDNRIPRGAAHR